MEKINLTYTSYYLSKELHRAVRSGSVVMVKLLLWAGAGVNARDSTLRTALHWACESTHEGMQRVIEVLLKYRAEVNVQDCSGRTPLHEACLAKKQSAVNELLVNGAKIGIQDNNGVTPLHETCDFFSMNETVMSIITALLPKHITLHSEEKSIHNLPYQHETKEILDTVNSKTVNGVTALQLACHRNNKDLVLWLLCMGANVEAKDRAGMTALHRAGVACAGDIIDILVDNGGNVNAKASDGNTPLHLACLSKYYNKTISCSREKTIDILLRKGANMYEKNMFLKTPYEELDKKWSCRLSFNRMMAIERIFIKHNMRELKKLGDFNMTWILGPENYNKVRNECCQELKVIKSTNILKDVLVFDVLSNSNQPFHLTPVDLSCIGGFLDSPKLLKRFPLYGQLLRTAFQRTKLLREAMQSFYSEHRKQMVQGLPFLVIVHLLTFLTNKDLKNLIQSQ